MNISIGAVAFDLRRLQFFSASFPYFHSALLFAIPNGKPFTTFEKLFLPFKYIIWSCIASLFAIGFIVIVSLKWCSKAEQRKFIVGAKNRTPYINMINICLGGSVTTSPKRNFARYVLIVWLIGCIILRNAYQGSLFDVLRKLKTTPPKDTLDAMVDANYSLYMRPNLFYLFDNITKAHNQ